MVFLEKLPFAVMLLDHIKLSLLLHRSVKVPSEPAGRSNTADDSVGICPILRLACEVSKILGIRYLTISESVCGLNYSYLHLHGPETRLVSYALDYIQLAGSICS